MFSILIIDVFVYTWSNLLGDNLFILDMLYLQTN